MKPPTSVFQLARMRRLDLLALYHRLHPDSHESDSQFLASMSNDLIVTAITQARWPRT